MAWPRSSLGPDLPTPSLPRFPVSFSLFLFMSLRSLHFLLGFARCSARERRRQERLLRPKASRLQRNAGGWGRGSMFRTIGRRQSLWRPGGACLWSYGPKFSFSCRLEARTPTNRKGSCVSRCLPRPRFGPGVKPRSKAAARKEWDHGQSRQSWPSRGVLPSNPGCSRRRMRCRFCLV